MPAFYKEYSYGEHSDPNPQNLPKRSTDELIAEAEARIPDWAVARAHGELLEGAQLPTRDGRRMGNAHIVKISSAPKNMAGLNYLLLTDAGNTFVMSEAEIHEQFYPPEYISRVDDVIDKFWRGPEKLIDSDVIN